MSRLSIVALVMALALIVAVSALLYRLVLLRWY